MPSDDRKRARLNCISHLLSQFAYEAIPEYDDQASLVGQNFVPGRY